MLICPCCNENSVMQCNAMQSITRTAAAAAASFFLSSCAKDYYLFFVYN
jgi:hypothetical protein